MEFPLPHEPAHVAAGCNRASSTVAVGRCEAMGLVP
jgi:hypothetical protein